MQFIQIPNWGWKWLGIAATIGSAWMALRNFLNRDHDKGLLASTETALKNPRADDWERVGRLAFYSATSGLFAYRLYQSNFSLKSADQLEEVLSTTATFGAAAITAITGYKMLGR